MSMTKTIESYLFIYLFQPFKIIDAKKKYTQNTKIYFIYGIDISRPMFFHTYVTKHTKPCLEEKYIVIYLINVFFVIQMVYKRANDLGKKGKVG